MNTKTNEITIFKICLTGLMSALVLLSTFFSIQITLPGLNTMIHFGNVLCLVSAFVLGPLYGGLASGIGSSLYDLFSAIYVTSAPFSFVFKFLMSFVCGKVSHIKGLNALNFRMNLIGACLGMIIYIFLHLGKMFIGNMLVGINVYVNLLLLSKSFLISGFNALIAVVIAVPLGIYIRKTMDTYIH